MAEEEQRGAPGTARRDEALADDEISLFDLWAVLADRKWVVLGVFALVMVLSGVYAVSRPENVTLAAIVELGRVPGVADAELPPVLVPAGAVDELNSVLIPAVMAQADPALRPPSASIRSASARLVEITVEAPRAQLDAHLALLGDSAAALLEAHARWRGRITQPRADHLAALADHLASMESTIEELEDRRVAMAQARQRLAGDGSVEIALLSLNSESLLLQRLAGLRAERRELRERVADLRRQQALGSGGRLVVEPAVSGPGSGPGVSLILTLGVVLGGMLGIFAAFFREFVARASEHRREREAATH